MRIEECCFCGGTGLIEGAKCISCDGSGEVRVNDCPPEPVYQPQEAMKSLELIEALLELEKKATDGVWQAHGLSIYKFVAGGHGQQSIASVECSFRETRHDDAELITASRNSLRPLCLALKEALEALEKIAKADTRYFGYCEHKSKEAIAKIEKIIQG